MRTRATNVEWVAYYQRADTVRKHGGDRFRRVVERGCRRGQLFRVVVAGLAIVTAAAMVVGALWLFNNVDWPSLAERVTAVAD